MKVGANPAAAVTNLAVRRSRAELPVAAGAASAGIAGVDHADDSAGQVWPFSKQFQLGSRPVAGSMRAPLSHLRPGAQGGSHTPTQLEDPATRPNRSTHSPRQQSPLPRSSHRSFPPSSRRSCAPHIAPQRTPGLGRRRCALPTARAVRAELDAAITAAGAGTIARRWVHRRSRLRRPCSGSWRGTLRRCRPCRRDTEPRWVHRRNRRRLEAGVPELAAAACAGAGPASRQRCPAAAPPSASAWGRACRPARAGLPHQSPRPARPRARCPAHGQGGGLITTSKASRTH